MNTFIDAATDSVARAIAAVQKEASRESELRDAQFAARMADFDRQMLVIADLERQLSERLASLKDGEPGRDGVDGERGADGANGADGKDGLAGADGRSISVDDVAPMIAESVALAVAALPIPADGKDGRDGIDGKDGTDGVGRDGKDGVDGERGPEGPIGKLPIVLDWQDRVYYEGEVVTRDGSVFQSICDTGKAPGHEDWRCIVAAGKEGREGRSFTVRETWKEEAEYRALDVVALNGAAFVARHDEPGTCPGEGWQIISMQGKQGKPGPKGDIGHSRGLTHLRLDGEMLVGVNADGSTVECDFYPLLEQIAR